MKRLILLFFVTALFIFSLSSCHGSKDVSPLTVPDEFDENQSYEITFWAKNDTNAAQTEIYKNAISEFEALYPNITVKLRLYNDYGKIYNDVIANIATNTTPNVCITYPDHIAAYLAGENTVAPLDSLMENESYGMGGKKLRFSSPSREEIIPEFLAEGKISGKQYALPFMRSTEACYVNKTYVEKLGYELPDVLTWDFVFEVCEKAMKKTDDGTYLINGQNVLIPFIYKSTDNMLIQMLRQKSIPYSDENGSILIFNDDVKDLLLKLGAEAGKRRFSTFKISGYPANFLNAGQCIFAVDSTAGATWMGFEAPLIDISRDKLTEFETAVMTVPQASSSDSPVMISQGPSVCVFNKEDGGEVLASWLFAQFLLTDEVQIAYSQTEGYVPVTSKAQNSKEYREYLENAGSDGDVHYDVKLKATKLLLSNTENTFTTPVFNGSASLRNAAGQLIEEVVKSARRNEKIDNEYIDRLYENVASLYRLGDISPAAASEKELGPLPTASKVLLITLAAVWIFIIVYAIISRKKSQK